MKKIALLGATGYIGKSLVPEFLALGNEYELFLFSRSKDKLEELFGTMDNSHMYDLHDFPLYKYDSIINCTGIGETSTLKERPADIFRVTEDIDTVIIAYLEKYPKTLYINLSSGAAYGDNFEQPVTAETKAIFNINRFAVSEFYSIAKANSEAKHRALAHLSIVDLRVFAFFSRFVNQESSFLMSEIVRCIKSKKILETTKEDIMRDYISPQDLFLLIVAVLAKGTINDVFDVYSAKPVSKFDLLSFLEKKYGLHHSIKEAITPPLSFKRTYYSENKKAATIGYVPAYDSLSGIESELDALLAEPLSQGA